MDVKANSDLLWRLILIILHTPFFVHLNTLHAIYKT